MDDLIVKVTVDLEHVALGDVISTADLHCRQLTQSTKSKNQSVFLDSLKEIVRVEHSCTVRGNMWDATLLLGIEIISMGFTGTMLVVGSILANVYIQIVICYFVCMLAYTRDAQLDESLINDAFLWRAGVSVDMVELVADHDFTLSVNSLQSHTHELYWNYFNELSYSLLFHADCLETEHRARGQHGLTPVEGHTHVQAGAPHRHGDPHVQNLPGVGEHRQASSDRGDLHRPVRYLWVAALRRFCLVGGH